MEENELKPRDSGNIVERNPDGTFKDGHPKLGGKVAGVRNFTTKVREALEKIADGKDYTYEEAFIKSIMKKAIMDGDASTQRLIWNYLDGMPIQQVNSNVSGNLVIEISEDIAKKYDTTPEPENSSTE
jgi:hypothetical protein